MVLPHLTENYGFSRDPPEKEAPQCAVHNFPHNIDQCLVLAQSEFVGALGSPTLTLTLTPNPNPKPNPHSMAALCARWRVLAHSC